MKKSLGILGTALALCFAAMPAQALVTYTLFQEDWEDGSWNGFTTYPGSNRGVVNVGETIYGAPATGATGTYMTSASSGSLVNGKMWPMYWHGGYQDSNSYYQIGSYGSSTGLRDQSLLGSTITFSFQSYISSYDAPQPGTELTAFVKFFNADFTYYYNWASIVLNLNTDPLDQWVNHSITVTTPNDAATAQFGFGVAQNNWSNGALNVDNMSVTVPEPSSGALMGLGLAGVMAFRLRRKV
mgnify:CR=1 FL=1